MSVDIISTFGFPIFCVISLGTFIWKVYSDFSNKTASREEKLYNVIAECQVQMRELGDTNRSFVDVLKSLQGNVDSLAEDVDDIKDYLDLNKRDSDKKGE